VINKWAYIWVGLYSGRVTYIWNEVSLSTCGGLTHGGSLYLEVYGILQYISSKRKQSSRMLTGVDIIFNSLVNMRGSARIIIRSKQLYYIFRVRNIINL
jgi:hypothetical protein